MRMALLVFLQDSFDNSVHTRGEKLLSVGKTEQEKLAGAFKVVGFPPGCVNMFLGLRGFSAWATGCKASRGRVVRPDLT